MCGWVRWKIFKVHFLSGWVWQKKWVGGSDQNVMCFIFWHLPLMWNYLVHHDNTNAMMHYDEGCTQRKRDYVENSACILPIFLTPWIGLYRENSGVGMGQTPVSPPPSLIWEFPHIKPFFLSVSLIWMLVMMMEIMLYLSFGCGQQCCRGGARKYCVGTPPSNYSLCQWEGGREGGG